MRGVRVPRALAFGLLRFIVGVALLFAAADVARPGMPTHARVHLHRDRDAVAALLVEQLVGPDLRKQLLAGVKLRAVWRPSMQTF